jgi:hypothetical protein
MVAARLRERRAEIDEAVIHRAFSVAPPSGKEAPGYAEALRDAIPSAVEYAMCAIALGEEAIGPTPAAISVQSAASARNGVGLEVVLRRYAAGYSTINDFLHREVLALGGEIVASYGELQRDLAALFDRLIVDVSETYRREEKMSTPTPRRRQAERIRRLLAGELVDPKGLDYPMEGYHLALIGSGPDAEEAVPDAARAIGRRILLGDVSAGHCTAWLGGRGSFQASEIEALTRLLADATDLRVCLGEPGEGLAGWRRSRRQAEAAELVAERGYGPIVRYGDVALVAAALRDPELHHFLREAYVEPLRGDRSALMDTLLTFLELNRNASATAAALGIARQTVASHLRAAEERLGRPPEACAAQLEIALRVARLTDRTSHPGIPTSPPLVPGSGTGESGI